MEKNGIYAIIQGNQGGDIFMNIVFSGPSGAGKGTLTEMFLKDITLKNLQHVQQENHVKVKKTVSIIIFMIKKHFYKR